MTLRPCSWVVFTHRTIHWGSRGGRLPAGAPPPDPRVNISFGFADDAFEPAYVSRADLPFPPMAHRAALAGTRCLLIAYRCARTTSPNPPPGHSFSPKSNPKNTGNYPKLAPL